MSTPADPAELVGLSADERLLGADGAALPEAERFAEPPVRRSRGSAAIVAVGATMTGVTLLGGAILALAGLVLSLADGAAWWRLAMLVAGALLVATHWGWVHVAEAIANGTEERARGGRSARARAWLGALEPYSRWSVTTTAQDDGAIRIERFHHRPLRAGEGTFTFVRESEAIEVHGADEPSVSVVERAEELRREAALDTARERERLGVAAAAFDAALAGAAGDEQERAARAAAARALSEQINRNLREPPLVE